MKLQTNPCKSLVLLACHVVVIRSPRCVRQDEKIPLVSKFDSCSKPNAFTSFSIGLYVKNLSPNSGLAIIILPSEGFAL